MRKRPGPDRIASILRGIQADLDAGLNVNQACRKAGIAVTTYYRWKSLQENPVSSEQFRMTELEAEVSRLKLLVAELALDRRMLQEALKKKPRPPHDAARSPPTYVITSMYLNVACPVRWTCLVPASGTRP
jgi:putative transposase